jgi:CBS-domain-containing membrane protein
MLILVCGVGAWASGYPVLFPSLGPSAHLLATRPDSPESAPHRVVVGHVIGTVVGLCVHAVVAPELGLSALSIPFSAAGLRLGIAAVLSVAGTTAVMTATGVRHTPACATTLLVALGVLSTPGGGVIIMVAVCLLVCAQQLIIAVDFPE